jgi:hypothetical protein
MFGLFQTDLPFGKRLWLTLLALVVAGAIVDTPLASAGNDPIRFATSLLLLYGQANLLAAFPTAIFAGPLIAIEQELKKRADRTVPSFYKATEDYDPLYNRVSLFIGVIFFLAIVVWIADEHVSAELGTIGLGLLLLGEIVEEWRQVYRTGFQHVELRREDANTLRARLIEAGEEQRHRFSGDWVRTVAHLADNRWEVILLTEQSALFRRSYDMGLLHTKWVEGLPQPLRRFLGPHSRQRRVGRID